MPRCRFCVQLRVLSVGISIRRDKLSRKMGLSSGHDEMNRIGEFLMRHRWTLRDLAVVLAAVLLTAYGLLEVDVFVAPGQQPVPGTIEYDELPILGLVISIGLIGVIWRKNRQVRRLTVERLEAQRKLGELAFVDPLTSLPNRRSCLDALSAAIASPPGADRVHALLLIDLNGFKQINDVYGHNTGDQALIEVGQRLMSVGRTGDKVCRLGGDEFAVVAEHCRGAEAVTSLGMRLIAALEPPLLIAGIEHRVGAGIGVCLIPFDDATVEETLRRADVALYRAKAQPLAALRFFDAEMDALLRERDIIDRSLPEAVATGAIHPAFQPLVDLSSHAVAGFKATAEWPHATLGLLRSEQFMPAAEDAGVASRVFDHVLRDACRTAAGWPDPVFLSVNVAANQFLDPALSTRVLAILEQAGLQASRLEVEIGESALVRHLEAARTTLGSLREAGVRIALNDFGTGYSSLYHLRNFQLDRVTIDRSLVERMGSERESEEIVSALIGLGRGFGLTIAAEGIDRSVEASALLTHGCQLGQGDLYGEPAPASQTIAWLAADEDR
ncbi:MAG: EAL domain-containing protein [Luteibacter sp.]|uniref:putative bifunctional diguanylate cyclase/phosphodiesterase n=1 Tax=Luteibacter sp. TaxID=1886636 RepID=UPI00280A2175|nr:EAL domain-containing protein [Luteibacter sp.]MDQ7995233.1 EAL domain-containing protein [Luteibacter sp.]